ncbi:hypothetical protein [Pleurocapsa sp. PCC 7319]|uniref:hypothetical protein n=1 Tax=Pleurocapsa sp. PCC 7319 TaxID=118161 RepID=UPI000345499F|nr:hypothetical protein [Pleurocapsa sp. PCC 7319]
MNKKFRKYSAISTVVATVFPSIFIATIKPVLASNYLPEQRPGWCKNEVLDRYNTYMADVTITGQKNREVSWKLDSTGRKGTCLFNSNNEFVRIKVSPHELHYKATGAIYWNKRKKKWIAPDGGICHTCSPENGFPMSPKTQDGFFFLPDDNLWYDPDGHECYSCNPANGFPIPPS